MFRENLPIFAVSLIGYASDVFEMLKTPIKNQGDDQLYYTKAFLDPEIRKKLQIKLDYESAIFQNLNGAKGQLKYNEMKN